VRAAPTAVEALRRIATRAAPFVSRGDSSGTHVKELLLWTAAGINPREPWYIVAGVDQAATLRLAEEREAYALADLPTFARLPGIQLNVLLSHDSTLANPYSLYVARSSRSPEAAASFARWAMQEWRQRLMISPGFVALSGACAAPVPGDSWGGESDAVGGSRTESRPDPHAARRSRPR
jgi:tungstate transport system substrate-binding protein